MMNVSGQVVNLVGYAAATLTTISFVPQVVRVIKLRSARDVSLGMFVIFSTGTFLWLVYGVLLHGWPLIAANGLTFVLSMTILILKLRFDRHATDVHPTGAPR